MTIEAFNGTRKVGSAHCIVPGSETNFDGLLSESKFFGCPHYIMRTGYAGITVRASPMLELDYSCSVKVTDGEEFFYNMSSNTSRLTINVWPEPPFFSPSMLVFNETDVAQYLVCNSRFGKPPASLVLNITQKNGRRLEYQRGTESVSIALPAPLREWHNAEALCQVENGESAQSSTVDGTLIVNYITSLTQEVLEVHTSWSRKTLDCSKDTLSFPDATFVWTIDYGSNPGTPNYGPSYTLPIGASGLVICTATNIVSSRSIQITYKATGTIASIVLVAVFSCVLVIFAVVAYKRRCFLEGYCRRKSHNSSNACQQQSEGRGDEDCSEHLTT